ncbi:MAG TPA: hypothetical protein VJ255_14730, partial [Candidatus Acidoferrum sp.]|nr:hypothetical protein [Candidatus Acidoferrum sp.]
QCTFLIDKFVATWSNCGAQKFHSVVSNEMSHGYISSVSCGIMGEMTIRQRQVLESCNRYRQPLLEGRFHEGVLL